MRLSRGLLRAAAGVSIGSATVGLAGCGASPIRVNGIVRESPEMRPLQNVQVDAYKQLHILVRPASASSQDGASACGATPLEGTSEGEDRRNLACVPADATNDAVRLVRQRLRAYGVQVVRDATEPYDYTLEVHVIGEAPQKPDPMAARVAVRLAYALRPDDANDGFLHGVDVAAAKAAFGAVVRDCGLHDGDLSAFATSSMQPMNPTFDIASVSADAVDVAIGCAELARFFRDAHALPDRAGAPPAP